MASDHTEKKKRRIIIIGLDSCDGDLVKQWANEGRLPFLASLMKKGLWTRLLSTRGYFSDAPWPSFNTGQNPAKHAFYNFLQIKRGTTEIRRTNAYDIPILPFWALLRDAGKKALVFDVPKTYPIDGLPLTQIASWGEHYPLMEGCSLPTSLYDELNSRFGKYKHPDEVVDPSLSNEVKLYKTMLMNSDKRGKVVRFLLEQEDWDLFITVFGETHYGGHQLYHHYNPGHWAHDSEKANFLGDSLPKVYSQIDAALAGALNGVSDDDILLIVSVHGISTNYSANHLMPLVMEKLGYQVRPEASTSNSSQKQSMLNALRDRIPQNLRDFVNERLLPQDLQDRLLSKLFGSGIDWNRSRAAFLPSDHFQGFITLNLKGREPYGIVQPGTEYDQVCSQLKNDLMQLVNPATGKPAIREVAVMSKIYKGDQLFNLPDLVICWAEDAYIRELHHPKFGVIADHDFKLRKSQHTSDGFMIACGNAIDKNAALDGASTMDIAPTILQLLGQSIPPEIDGKVLPIFVMAPV